MKKEQIKKILIPSSIFILICIIVFSILTIYQYHTYITTVNTTIENIVDEIRAQYPQVSEEKLIKIINGSINKKDASTLKKYGYTDNKVAYIKELEKSMKHSTIINLTVLIFIGIIGILILLLANKKQEKKIEEINHYLKTINNRNYQLKIEENTEDELSKLRNELYKTTVLLKESAENSEQEKINLSNSLADISHQLKTPLTSIINYVDLLKKEDIRNEKANEYIEILDSKSQRLKKLIEDLVEASKVSTGNVKLQIEKINIVELLNQAIGEFEDKFEAKKLEILLEAKESEIYILADSRYMYRIVENLFSNISKYALENSRVYIDIIKKSNEVYIEMKNISKEKLNISAEELMQRFVRGDKSRTTEGSGLGISIAQNLTEIQKGVFNLKLDGDLFRVELIFNIL